MADTMQFDLVSPERNLVSVQAREVRLPGNDGDLTAMPGHAATIVTLRPGVVTVVDGSGNATEFVVTGGFAEINGDSVSLLAERGNPRAEVTQEVYSDMLVEVYRRKDAVDSKAETVGDEVVAAAAKLLGDMEALGTHIGLDSSRPNFPA